MKEDFYFLLKNLDFGGIYLHVLSSIVKLCVHFMSVSLQGQKWTQMYSILKSGYVWETTNWAYDTTKSGYLPLKSGYVLETTNWAYDTMKSGYSTLKSGYIWETAKGACNTLKSGYLFEKKLGVCP